MTEKNLLKLILLHISIGFLISFYPFFSKIYAVLIVLVGFLWVVKSKNKNDEILVVIAYIVGVEVFLRTTYGNPFHEFGKYFMLLFAFLGLLYSGNSQNHKNPYWIYLVLIVPGIIISLFTLTSDVKRKIFFEILGPICLGVLSLYTYKREISAILISKILTFIALPIVSTCVYLMLNYSINNGDLNENQSNYFYSGNYAPNQLATVLGLGLVIYFIKIVTENCSKKLFFITLIVFCGIAYRGFLTFSRGGIITSFMVILTLILVLYKSQFKVQLLKGKIGITLFLLLLVFGLTSIQTGGKLSNRYVGSVKKTPIAKSDRLKQIKYDLNVFQEKPVLGIGVGGAKEIRKTKYNIKVSTHTEFSRMLSEHGYVGVLLIFILIFFPLKLYFKELNNIYALPFLVFWILTINHSATRIAAPSFIYALALLQIKDEKKKA